MVQNVMERNFDIVCVLEPASVPRTPHWYSSANGSAAIFVRSRDISLGCILKKTGRNFLVFKYSRYFIFSVYIAPRESNADFHNTLDELSNAVRDLGGNCIIADDFNAKSTLWGSPHSDWRSLALERWAAELELRLINSDASPTCVRFNGASVIDLTWSSAGICNLLSDWRVLSDEVSLSDYRYIVFRIGDAHDGRIFRHAHHMR